MTKELNYLQSIHTMMTQICEHLDIDVSGDPIHTAALAEQTAKERYAQMRPGGVGARQGAKPTPAASSVVSSDQYIVTADELGTTESMTAEAGAAATAAAEAGQLEVRTESETEEAPKKVTPKATGRSSTGHFLPKEKGGAK
jgi:hypothetical protein